MTLESELRDRRMSPCPTPPRLAIGERAGFAGVCPTSANRATRPDLVTRETEAEAVTYLLCAQRGIAGTEASIDYNQSYRGTPDTLDASLERIRSTAQRLIVELDAIRMNVEHDPDRRASR